MKKEKNQQTTWKHMFLFTKDGRLQSMDLMYSFFLAIGILFLNFAVSNRITILFESAFPSLSRVWKNLLDILIPAVLCTLAAALLFRIIRKKKIVLMAYCTALLLVVIILVIILFEFDRDTLEVLLPAYAGIFLIPAAAGTAVSVLHWRNWSLRNPDPLREEPQPAEEEQTDEPAANTLEDEISGWRQFRS